MSIKFTIADEAAYLSPPFFGEFDPVIWDHLVNLAVSVAFGLGMADEDDEAWFTHLDVVLMSRRKGYGLGGKDRKKHIRRYRLYSM